MNPDAQQPPTQTEQPVAPPTPAHPTVDLINDPRFASTMEGLDADETLVCEIHKHPIGLIGMYAAAIIGIAAAAAVTFFLLPQLVSGDSQSRVQGYLAVALIVATMFLGLGLLVATYVYRQTKLIITNKNVTQIIQRSLFSRKVSELSMSNVEDVSAERNGIIQSIFNYGILHIQTAGELENFIFDYCPRPNYFGRIILEARQQYADSLKEEA